MVRVWLHADRAYAGAPITNTVSLYMGSEGGASDTHGGLCVDEARSCLVFRWTRCASEFLNEDNKKEQRWTDMVRLWLHAYRAYA